MILEERLSIKMPVCFKLIYGFNISLMKIAGGISEEMYKLMPKFAYNLHKIMQGHYNGESNFE